MPTAAHSSHSDRVASSTSSLAATTNNAQSAARRPARSSPTKSAYPGVSTRLTLVSAWTRGATASEMDRPCACSDSSKSHTVVPSRTDPARGTAPEAASSVSTRVVLPEPPGPTSTTLRIRSGLLASRSWPAALRELVFSAMSPPRSRRAPRLQGLRLRGNTRDGRRARAGGGSTPASPTAPPHGGPGAACPAVPVPPCAWFPVPSGGWGPPVSRTEDPLLHGVSKGSASTRVLPPRSTFVESHAKLRLSSVSVIPTVQGWAP